MSWPNQERDIVGIVVGKGDEDRTQSGKCYVYLPSQYSNDYKLEDLVLMGGLSSADRIGSTSASGPPEPGTMVMVRKNAGHAGTPHGYITGVVKEDTNTNQVVKGNMSIRSHKLVEKAFNEVLPINSKAKAGKGPGNSKPTEEAGPKYKHDLVKGIPSSSTLWPIAGMKIPQSKNINTATQAFNNIMSPDVLSQLPGIGLSMGNMFNLMPQVLKDQLFDALPEGLGETLETMINLIPEASPDAGNGIRINPEVFFPKAVEVLSKCRDTTDIIDCIMDLMTNTEYHGADTLPSVSVKVDTPFGQINMEFDVAGNAKAILGGDAQKAVETFTKMLSGGGGGFPGVIPDKNLWRGSSQVMGQMMSRLPPGEYKKAVQMAQKSVAPGTSPRQKLNALASKVFQGSDFIKG